LEDLRYILENPLVFLALFMLLDLIAGDPVYRWHPVRLIGDALSFFEKNLRRIGLAGYSGGVLLFICLILSSFAILLGVKFGLDKLHWGLGYAWYLFIAYSLIAVRDLCVHGQRIANAVEQDNLELAREKAACMVGRDIDKMDFSACCRAAVESLGENLTDGILTPLFFYFLFGVPGMLAFKVVSTMDSMVGYRNEKYLKFGWCGARLDDLMNFIPARISYILISLAGLFIPGGSFFKALRIGWLYHAKLPSPNSGWSEATLAGALQIKLVGPIWRKGKLATELWIGDPADREGGSPEDIAKTIAVIYLVTMGFIMIFAAFSFYTKLIPVQL
jgi:adenosylcobinamide-phosphate synthase